ncbi:MAG: hypothetical protein IKD44_08085 [Lentisphaeria bacterium]|nr:hypothetical protein [Lentisphaeria bacterium]
MEKSITFSFPLERPHCGVPLANGNFGALVWGKETLCITVNQSDLWDHRCGRRVDSRDRYSNFVEYAALHGCTRELNSLFHREDLYGAPHRMAVGRFEFTFAPGIVPATAELDYFSGKLKVTLSDGTALELCLVLAKNTLYVEDPAQKIKDVLLKPATDFPQTRAFYIDRGNAMFQLLEDGWRIPLARDPDFTVRAVKTSYGYRLFTNEDKGDAGKEKEIRATSEWWSQLFSKVCSVRTPDEWWNRFFTFQTWKLAAATAPMGKAAGLQGPWHEEYQEAKWAGDYHFNVNVQMVYGPLCRLGLHEHLLPLFDMIESPAFQESMKHNARALFGVEDALWQLHAVDDRGWQCGGISCGAVLDPACGAWTALLYEEYFRHTCDMEFLRERAYPYIYGIMRGYEEMLDREFNIPVAISAEYASSNLNMTTVAGRNPSYQLAAIRRLAAILIEFSTLLKVPERPVWRQILDKVPHFTTVGGYDSYARQNEARIAIWENQDLEVCHRHHSHLGCIWPFDSLPAEPSEEIRQVVENSVTHWISMGMGKWSEWCIPWANIIYTRTGLNEAPMQLFNMWKEIFVNEGLSVVYLPRMLSLIAHRRHDIARPKEESEVMQLDGTGGFLDAFMQMCAYTKENRLHLFKGMPARWQDVEITRLHLPGKALLSASKSGRLDLDPGNLKWDIRP